MHRLSSSFVLGYHGCDRAVGERLLAGVPFIPSTNEFDWLGPGIYFWEANPHRGLQFASEASARTKSAIDPFVVGAVIDPGLCLDLTSSVGIEWARLAYHELAAMAAGAGWKLKTNSKSGLIRNLDCAVIGHLHKLLRDQGRPPIDTVKGIFIEGAPIYPGAGIHEKTHVQIAVCNPACIKGIFRVPASELRTPANPI